MANIVEENAFYVKRLGPFACFRLLVYDKAECQSRRPGCWKPFLPPGVWR